MLVTGVPGLSPQNNLIFTLKIDTVPLPAVPVAAFLPDGRQFFSATTDSTGTAVFFGFKIPYVANGSFFFLRPDAGKIISPPCAFRIKDLDPRLSKNPEQVLMFKLTRPTFLLNYKATAVNDIAIPKDFSAERSLSAFIRDSCFIDKVQQSSLPDILIDITNQVSRYDHDSTEETILKVETAISIQEQSQAKPRTATKITVYEKAYERNADIPLGLFFWEATRSINSAIKSALGSL
jgi:hypothetical protein